MNDRLKLNTWYQFHLVKPYYESVQCWAPPDSYACRMQLCTTVLSTYWHLPRRLPRTIWLKATRTALSQSVFISRGRPLTRGTALWHDLCARHPKRGRIPRGRALRPGLYITLAYEDYAHETS